MSFYMDFKYKWRKFTKIMHWFEITERNIF